MDNQSSTGETLPRKPAIAQERLARRRLSTGETPARFAGDAQPGFWSGLQSLGKTARLSQNAGADKGGKGQ